LKWERIQIESVLREKEKREEKWYSLGNRAREDVINLK
jgi:hypothetical protein